MKYVLYVEDKLMTKEILRRYITSSDWHVRFKNPRRRKDFFYGSQKMKVRKILRLYDELTCDGLLVAGDIFDSSTTPYLCVGDYISMFLSRSKVKFISIFGQHDLRFHSLKSKKNTPLWSFLKALRTSTIDQNPFLDEKVGINIYGTSWSQQIPVIKSDDDSFNILLIHTMVTEDNPLFPGQAPRSYTEATKLLKKASGFNVVISGDNHQSFSLFKNNRLLINPGTIVRKSWSERHHLPRVGILTIYSDYSFDFEWKYIPVAPIESVFKEEKAGADVDDSTFDPELEEFLKSLKSHTLVKPDFVNDLVSSLDVLDDQEVVDIILDFASRVRQKFGGSLDAD